jgi:NitT/TauT family transport system substrate-binding protein
MKRHTIRNAPLVLLVLGLCLAGCPSSDTTPTGSTGGNGTNGDAPVTLPVFSLAWSEYPSWSVFGVAHEQGLIDKAEGKQGTVEKKWNVDIVLTRAEYLECLTMYGAGTADAACITNTDILAICGQRPAVAVLPTSTSDGADACLAVGIDDLEGLKGVEVKGAELSVSQYCFERYLEIEGEDLADYKFANMDPGAAATQMASGTGGVEAIMVWNPFVMNVKKEVPEVKVLFDSTAIPGEIVDMVVVGRDSLEKPGGEAFACAVIDAFYQVSDSIEGPATRDDALLALGREFAQLGVEDMETCVEQTKFYKTPDAALAVFEESAMAPPMQHVADFCTRHSLVMAVPTIAYGPRSGAADAQLLFDPSYIRRVQDGGP